MHYMLLCLVLVLFLSLDFFDLLVGLLLLPVARLCMIWGIETFLEVSEKIYTYTHTHIHPHK